MSDAETKNEQDIALIKQEIGYIKTDTTDIKASLKIMLENYITRRDVESKFERMQNEIDGRITGANNRIDTKTDKEEFHELKEIVNSHLKSGAVSVGQITQNVLTTIITAIVLGAIVYAVQAGFIK
jgi:hypothetical protein